ncbi:MAG: cellulase family glycosylhydrolase [Anaerolineales bacterium]|nr:cellulase family glycosylhydrolase [Anaerolineales bacterium]
MQHFLNGVNLGGWLSQYQEYDHEHFRTFITRSDIEQIASWGMDHVRLPVDYPVLESDEDHGVYREEGFAYLDACLEWCRSNRIGLVLDLHQAPGYSFNNTLYPETRHLNVLFDQPAARARFVALWQAIVRRYRGADLPLVYELLNEVVLPDSAPWNALAHQTVAAIRAIDPQGQIMIGGNNYNAAAELKNIALLDDPNVGYTFHFYEPQLFTHQKAHWVQAAVDYDQTLEYPGAYVGLADFLERAPQHRDLFAWQVGWPLDRALLLEFLQPALDFARQTRRNLYCGEFGVIESAPPASRLRWHADLLDILRQHGIGRAVWSYKLMDFGLVNAAGEVVDPALIEIVRQP